MLNPYRIQQDAGQRVQRLYTEAEDVNKHSTLTIDLLRLFKPFKRKEAKEGFTEFYLQKSYS